MHGCIQTEVPSVDMLFALCPECALAAKHAASTQHLGVKDQSRIPAVSVPPKLFSPNILGTKSLRVAFPRPSLRSFLA